MSALENSSTFSGCLFRGISGRNARGDRVINVCEMKYSSGEYSMSEEEGRKLQRRMEVFRTATRTAKGLMPTLVCNVGLKRNASSAFIQAVVTLDDLFRE